MSKHHPDFKALGVKFGEMVMFTSPHHARKISKGNQGVIKARSLPRRDKSILIIGAGEEGNRANFMGVVGARFLKWAL